MICFHPQTWPFAFPYVKSLYRTFCNYAFYSPPIQTNYKSRKTQLRLRNVKRFAPLQTQTDTQMLEHTHTLSSYTLTYSGTYILSFCLVSRPSAVHCHSPHFMLLSQDIFPQISHTHVPSDSSHTCQKHTAHTFNSDWFEVDIKSKLTLDYLLHVSGLTLNDSLANIIPNYCFVIISLCLWIDSPLSLTSPIVNQ